MGSQHQALLGTAFVEHLHPDDVEQALALFRQVSIGHAVHPQVVRLSNGRGDTIAVNWMFTADALGTGGLIGVGQFIHPHERTADVASTRDLNEPAKEPEADLACALSGGELKRFATRAAHDLSGPIRAIAGLARIVGEDFSNQLDPTACDYLNRMVDAAERAKRLVDGAMDYLRLEAECEPWGEVDLDGMVREMIPSLEGEYTNGRIEIQSDPLPSVRGDARQLRRLLENLLRNGLMHNVDPNPLVQIAALPPSDAPRPSSGNGRLALWVQDNGVGIQAKNQQDGYDVFRKLTSESPGIGLGLAIAKRIVKRHGGELGFQSGPEGGSRFVFDLPAAADRTDRRS